MSLSPRIFVYNHIKAQLMHTNLFITKFHLHVSANVANLQGVLLQNTSSVVYGQLFIRVE
jgi:hypothetical protein